MPRSAHGRQEPGSRASGRQEPGSRASGRQESGRQNIVLIMADQLAAHALEREREYVATPHLDSLAANSLVFERAYATFPLCVPSRTSMLTGRMPHEIGIGGNAADSWAKPNPCADLPDSLGHTLSAAGYECAWAGKWHATGASLDEGVGMEMIHPFGDRGLVEACSRWLAGRRRDSRPFFLCASFDDPHTICEYARSQPMPYGNTDEVPVREAPGLPDNFEPAPFSPSALQHEKHAAERVYGTEQYSASQWRSYRATYRRLIERVDRYIGELLEVLQATGLRESTVVIFTSDHGDGDASHRWNQKTALYEECTRVPLYLSVPGAQTGRSRSLVSVGLDLFPTLCSVAGIAAPASAGEGHSFHELDEEAAAGRVIAAETMFEQGSRPFTRGRALYWGRFKYTIYNWGSHREQLHDLRDDPGEMRNLAVEARFDEVLNEMRAKLLAWCQRTEDMGALKYLVLPDGTDPSVHDEIFAIPY